MSTRASTAVTAMLIFAIACTHATFSEDYLLLGQWGVIGDSWASGVTYGIGGSTDYDNNQDGCLRLANAWGPQLENNLPFPLDIGSPTLQFKACSGARLINMAYENPQMDLMNDKTQFVVMQAGGNNVGFYNIARDCIYHVDYNITYNGQYPEPGACLNSINASNEYIEGSINTRGTLSYDLRETITDILGHRNAQTKGFRLYVLGYAHYFNIDAPDSDWCNDQSFSLNLLERVRPKAYPPAYLNLAVRTRINDLVTRVNAQIDTVVSGFNPSQVSSIQITQGFDGHRFCEKGHTYPMQYGYINDEVWFWNASPKDTILPSGVRTPAAQLFEQEFIDQVWMAGYGNFSSPNIKDFNVFNWTDVDAMDKGIHAQSPTQGGTPGFALRPFHPTGKGHTAIMNAIKPRIIADYFQQFTTPETTAKVQPIPTPWAPNIPPHGLRPNK